MDYMGTKAMVDETQSALGNPEGAGTTHTVLGTFNLLQMFSSIETFVRGGGGAGAYLKAPQGDQAVTRTLLRLG